MEFPEHGSPVAPRHRPMCHSLCRHLHPSADLVPSQLGSAPAELALVLPAHQHHRIYGEKVSKQGLELTHAMETKYVDAQVPPVPPNHPGFVLQPQRPPKKGGSQNCGGGQTPQRRLNHAPGTLPALHCMLTLCDINAACFGTCLAEPGLAEPALAEPGSSPCRAVPSAGLAATHGCAAPGCRERKLLFFHHAASFLSAG